MKAGEIRKVILDNLEAGSGGAPEIRVQPDPFGGWRIAVVWSGFDGHPIEARRRTALTGIEHLSLSQCELLTPDELKWTGALPLDSDLTDAPLWPTALARASLDTASEKAARFPSDLEVDLERPLVITFYSVRGGVGRTTALAYTGAILASRGRKVLCVDMDMEAPGLAAIFGQHHEIEDDMGVLSLLVSLDRGDDPDINEHLLRVSETDDLFCLPAGKPNARYAHLLELIDPAAWYREDRNPLRILMDRLSNGLAFTPDVIILDSRTGITALSGPLLFDLADIAVVVFFPHPQAQEATEALVHALLSAKTRRHVNGSRLAPEPRFIISPIPSGKFPEITERYEQRALKWIRRWLMASESFRPQDGSGDEGDMTHFIPYREIIATSDKMDVSDPECRRIYEPVADWVERFLPAADERSITETLSDTKNVILEDITFSAGTAERQESLTNTFVLTKAIEKAIDPAHPLVLGRKGTGKTAIFRRIHESETMPSVIILAPSGMGDPRRNLPWLMGADGFHAAEKALQELGLEWRQFWTAYICCCCRLQWPFHSVELPDPPSSELAEAIRTPPDSEMSLIQTLKNIFAIQHPLLALKDWLGRMDAAIKYRTMLLVDGLDTGFGNTEDARRRRKSAIEGLFAFFTDQEDLLTHLKLKIMLREDIWKRLKFENKSHLFGRFVSIRWNDPASYFKVVLKQVFQSEPFRNTVERHSGALPDPSRLDAWGDQDVFAIWNILVGERMKGGKTAFTRNWVWNRLADGNGDHSPRNLLQLFSLLPEWERTEQKKSKYPKSLFRPRGLIDCLPEVSAQAFQAMSQEEFPELTPLMERLRTIGRTPFSAEEVAEFHEEVALALEVGLLTVYEHGEEGIQRYMVPELYRYGLEMKRKGRA